MVLRSDIEVCKTCGHAVYLAPPPLMPSGPEIQNWVHVGSNSKMCPSPGTAQPFKPGHN